MFLKRVKCKVLFIVRYWLCPAIVAFYATLIDADTGNGWKLLLDNKPYEAIEEFRKTIDSPDTKIASESYRGLAAAEMFMGKYDNILDYGISAYEKDRDILKCASHPEIILSGQSSSSSKHKRNLKVIEELAKDGGLFSGWYQDVQLKEYLGSGNLKKAQKLCKKMGIVSNWKFIGPFENISNCGFSNIYPPENEIRFDREYEGKNGNIVKWHTLFTTESRGWIFLDNITNEYNSVFYFTNTVTSRQEKEVYLSFGASGTFKILLNDVLVLQDSVFRNTGIDTYMQKVTLRKGMNRIIIKIGHEGSGGVSLSGRSNFLLRFLELNYVPVNNLQIDISDSLVASGSEIYPQSSNSSVLDSLTRYLNQNLEADSTDYDALLAIISVYNMYEMTNKSQEIIQCYLKKMPSSSLLHSNLAESFIRAKKYTESAVEMKKAFDLCNLNMLAWRQQLENIKDNGNLRMLEDFLKKSPETFRDTPRGMLAKLAIAVAQKNSSEIEKIIFEFETKYRNNYEIAITLVAIYSAQGKIDKAEKLLAQQIRQNGQRVMFYHELAQLMLKKGDRSGAIKWYQMAIAANAEDPDAYLNLSNIYYQDKKYGLALEYVEKCALLLPSNANVLNLKGNILSSMGKTEEAIASFKETIRYTSDDFSAWESIFRLEKQKSFEDMTPLPPLDSIISAASSWVKQNDTRASLVNFTEDIYMYASRASRSRTFIVVYLSSQQAIDEWKEYQIPYNPNYQLISVDRAFSRKNDGTEIDADHQSSFIVFKSLEPGDYIVLEYSIKDYYQGVMAGKVYGTQLFRNGIPEFSSMIRMVTPVADTIPVFISDTSFTVSSTTIQEYRIKTIKSKSSSEKIAEAFSPSYHPDYSAVVYSNFQSWKEIVDWYYELSRHKQKTTLELAHITDSLITGVESEWKKVLRIHEFISRRINYSYVPFRQSAWIPQSAGDVLATRIGDCKDMASLGKALLDIAKIESWLVLVNTRVRNFTGYAHLGPNFDHCILVFKIDGIEYFVDFTSRNTALGQLPAGEQGAMALVIKPGNDSLIKLPIDSSEKRRITRSVIMNIDSTGGLDQKVTTKRTGVYATSLREMYRFKSYEEQKKSLYRTLADEYPDVTLDTIYFVNIDSLNDSLDYVYEIRADHAAKINNSTALFSLKIPDALNSNYYPIDENRTMPVDMSYSAAGIAEQSTTIECSFPSNWKLINVPDHVEVHTDAIEYKLYFILSKGKIICNRSYKSNFTGVLSANDYNKELEALKSITRADDVKLVFTIK